VVWSDLVGSGAVLSDLVWSVQLDVREGGRELGSYRGDTKTMTLSEDKGHGKNAKRNKGSLISCGFCSNTFDTPRINGILYHSEAWHGLPNAHIAKLESMDEALLGGILKAHTKTPQEFIYLETGMVPVKWIIMQRRLNYLKHILSRDSDE
jgi:hypothetical protein